MAPKYITTSIVYPNARPHIGYAMELVQADFFARYYRLSGDSVRFVTGTDEHGLKIQRAAEKRGVEPQSFVDDMAKIMQDLSDGLHISYDRFIRTTDSDHIKMAQAMWQTCSAAGDIYKKSYKAWYNVKEEEFLGLVEDHPDSSSFGIDPQFIEKIEEENYFFALSRYKEKIVNLLKTGEYQVWPKSRAQEMLNFIQEKGLQDISISREKSKLEWGIPVPGDDNQVMYVWFDALTNYVTAVGKVDDRGIIQTDEFWPAFLHCIGKDISRFHGIIWPAMLLSAGLPVPKALLVHGFITVGGAKMSKSIGNVIDPFEVIALHGSGAVRWYLLKSASTADDSDFTLEHYEEVYNADLANDLGNLVSRVWTMIHKYCEGKIPQGTVGGSADAESVLMTSWKNYHAAVENKNIQSALQCAHAVVVFCNKQIEEYTPWRLAKDPQRADELNSFLYGLLETIRHATLMLYPALPITSNNIVKALFPTVVFAEDGSYLQGSKWGQLPVGSPIGSEQPLLFPKTPRP